MIIKNTCLHVIDALLINVIIIVIRLEELHSTAIYAQFAGKDFIDLLKGNKILKFRIYNK